MIRTKEKMDYNYTGLLLFKLFPLPKSSVVLKCDEQYLLLPLIDWGIYCQNDINYPSETGWGLSDLGHRHMSLYSTSN